MTITKKASALALGICVASAGFLLASPQVSSACTCIVTTSGTASYAEIFANTPMSCSTLGAQHQYHISSASKDYWTAWNYGRDDVRSPAQTTRVSQLFYSAV